MKKHIAEAYRYIDNAKKIMKTKLTVDNLGYYNDKKYVRAAGNYGYLAILEALQPFINTTQKKQRLSVDSYKDLIAQKDRTKTMNKVFVSAYNYLHLYAGYDGDLNTKTLKEGLKQAIVLIEWADENTTALGGIKTKK